jgi:hypothetical protein
MKVLNFKGPQVFHPFWTVLLYLTLIVMGLGQQIALVQTVTSGIISIRPEHFLQFESSITFLVCLLGYVSCFPMATEVTLLIFITLMNEHKNYLIFFQLNQFIVYFFDYNIGCGWWLMILYSLLFIAVLGFRGKPYSAGHFAK